MNLKEIMNTNKIAFAGLLIALGVLGRILFHDFFNNIINPISPNELQMGLDLFFIIGGVSLFAGFLLGKYYAFIVPLCVIACTDLFYAIVDPKTIPLWTTWLFLFTWSGYAVLALLGSFVKKKPARSLSTVPFLMGAGVLGVLFYDLWTNLGFWLTYSKMGWYPQTIEGLATVIIGGIPSMVWHLLSISIVIGLVSVPLFVWKKQEFFTTRKTSHPAEKYVLMSCTTLLLITSIITALL